MKAENEINRLNRRNSQLIFDSQETQKLMFEKQIGYDMAHLEQFKKQYDLAYKELRNSKIEIANKLESSLRIVIPTTYDFYLIFVSQTFLYINNLY